jgi:hypothetical protein
VPYALVSLTVVRVIPVAVALVGSRARAPTVAFVGWFGPRGLASIVFAVIIIEETNLSHVPTIVSAIYLAIGLSVLLHGLTAAPLANRYARWFGAHPRGGQPEMERAATKLQRPRRTAHGTTGKVRRASTASPLWRTVWCSSSESTSPLTRQRDRQCRSIYRDGREPR